MDKKERDALADTIEALRDAGTPSDGMPMILQDNDLRLEYNEGISDQNSAIKRAGAGIALIAVSWLAFDFVKARRRKTGLVGEATT